jgi:hypothetical protein
LERVRWRRRRELVVLCWLRLIMRPAVWRGQLARFELGAEREVGHQTQPDVVGVDASPSGRCRPASLTMSPTADRSGGEVDGQAAQRLGSQGCWWRTMA